MATKLYPIGLRAYSMEDLLTARMKIALVTATYVYSDAHQYLSDITNQPVDASYAPALATSLAIEVDTVGDTVTLSGSATFPALAGSDTITAAIAYVEAPTAGASVLIGYDELASPTVTNGGDFQYSSGAAGIVRISY